MSEQQLVPKPNPLFRSKSNAEVLEDFEDAKLREKYSATCTLEDNVEHIKAHLKKISKSLHGMSKSMGDYCEETQILCDLLKNFSWTVNSDDKEPIITKCANVLAQITKTQLSFMEQMNEILTSGVEKHLSDMKEDSLREAQQQLTKARDAYDALHRRLKTGEKRDVKKTKDFEVGQKDFEKKNLDYLNKLRDIQTICRFDFSQRLCALMFAYYSSLNQETQLINAIKTELNDVMTTMEHAKQDYLKNKDNEDHRISLYVKVSQEKGLAKQGYLYKQGKTGLWALRFVVLKEGRLSWFKRWKQQTQMDNIDLLLCAVRPVTEAEKPFCFEVVSPTRRLTFKALNQVDFQDWLDFIQNSINYSVTKNASNESENNSNTPKFQNDAQTKDNPQKDNVTRGVSTKSLASQSSKSNEKPTLSTEASNATDNNSQSHKMNENPPVKIIAASKLHRDDSSTTAGPVIVRSATDEALRERSASRERRAATVVVPGPSDTVLAELCSESNPLLVELRKLSDTNNYCADCGAEEPEWVSINIGAIICIDCSGIHRSLGTQYSKVRSLVMDILKPEVITYIKALNNRVVNQILEEVIPPNMTKITQNSDLTQKRDWIVLKYKERRFVKPPVVSQEELNKNCLTALREEKFRDALRFFLQGADLTWANKNDHQKTMAHYFVEEGNLVALLFVLLNGADAMQGDDTGKSPLDYAKEKLKSEQNPSDKLKDIVRLLQEYSYQPTKDSSEGATSTTDNAPTSPKQSSPIPTGRYQRSNSVTSRQKRIMKRSAIDIWNYISPKKKKDKKKGEKVSLEDSDLTLESSQGFNVNETSESTTDPKSTTSTSTSKSAPDNIASVGAQMRSDITGLKAIRLRFHRRDDTQPTPPAESAVVNAAASSSNPPPNASDNSLPPAQRYGDTNIQNKQTNNVNNAYNNNSSNNDQKRDKSDIMSNNNSSNNNNNNNNVNRPRPFAPASSSSPYAFSTVRRMRPLPERPNVLTVVESFTPSSRKVPLPPPRSPKRKAQLPPLPVKVPPKPQQQPQSVPLNNAASKNNESTPPSTAQLQANRPPSLTKALSSAEISPRSKNTTLSPMTPPPSPAPVPVPVARPKKMPGNAIRHFNAPFNTPKTMGSEPKGFGRGHVVSRSLVAPPTQVNKK